MTTTGGTILIVGGDLLGRTRIEDAVARNGFVPVSVAPNKLGEVDISQTRAVFADVDSDEVLAWVESLPEDVTGLRIGYYAHVDRSRAERVKAAGWDAMPRGKLFRDLPDLLASL